jgi:hypothetical protein
MSAVREAWFEAALDLRIRIQEPNPLEEVPDDAARIVYLPDFGSKRGAVVFAQDFAADPDARFNTKALKAAGYFFSILSLQGYSHYSRQDFIDTLVDWGYFGPAERCPEWYAVEVRKLTANREQGGAANAALPHR